MTDFPTFSDLFRISRDEALVRSAALTRVIAERAGTDANALLASSATVGDAVIGKLIQVQAAIFLSTAAGPDLDKLVFDRYNIFRKPDSPARGEVEFTTDTPAVAAFALPLGTKLRTGDGNIFLTTTAETFSIGSTGPVTVNVQSTLAGISQHAKKDTITTIAEPPLGSPADLRVTNQFATFGAGDKETDPELRSRAQLFYTTAFRGTLKAITRGALAIPGVRSAFAFEAINECGDPARWVELVVSDQLSEQLVKINTLPPEAEAQSLAVALEIQFALEEVRAGGIFVLVTVAVVEFLGVTLSLRFRRGFNVAAVTTQARGHTVSFINELRPGADFIPTALEADLKLIPGLEILGGEVVIPTGIVVATPTKVFRTTIALVIAGECTQL